MGIAAKHFYRFTYLKSEEWQNLRIAKLAERDVVCWHCKTRSLHNDVHHLRYKEKLSDVTLDDLLVLCRDCHAKFHLAIEQMGGVKACAEKTNKEMLAQIVERIWANEGHAGPFRQHFIRLREQGKNYLDMKRVSF